MLTVSALETIQDSKLRQFLETSYSKIHSKVGTLFDIYIKDFSVNMDLYNLDELVYNEVFIDYAIVPKPSVVFVSKYLPLESLNLPNASIVVKTEPSKRSVFTITRYNLHRLMCPTFHSLNLNTEFNRTSVIVTVRLYSETVYETEFGGVIGLPVTLCPHSTVLFNTGNRHE